MIRHHPLPPQTTSSQSFSNSRLSNLKEYASRRHARYWLAALAIIVIIAMVTGLIFTAHQYYHDFGGQGWLRPRTQHRDQDSTDTAQLFLPIRQIQVFKEQPLSKRQAANPYYANVPFYTCGDQQNSCQAYGQPVSFYSLLPSYARLILSQAICCPVGMTCYAASFTNSGIYCCNSTHSLFECELTKAHPPQCMASLAECSSETGGGCCPSSLECTPNGCVHVNNASIISSPSTVPISSSSGSSQSTQVSASTTSNSLGTPITVTSTIVQVPAATVTLAKEGEIAQASVGAGGDSIAVNLWVPYFAALVIVCIAGIMATM
ncbi:uncharacterized protein PAC_02939 [Phialocephala subalpina]|uniref:Uncharacterized protein n=1 Tax=Phialocephala subalpina TaxID=576137 RepID=A0A1L7WJX7_9HELO|nr:uncharacterized protein PAC_02939 [Phialocephala subalpina]